MREQATCSPVWARSPSPPRKTKKIKKSKTEQDEISKEKEHKEEAETRQETDQGNIQCKSLAAGVNDTLSFYASLRPRTEAWQEEPSRIFLRFVFFV